MAHIDQLLRQIDFRRRDTIQRFFNLEVPKLCDGFAHSAYINMQRDLFPNQKMLYKRDAIVSGRVCNLSLIIPKNEGEDERSYAKRVVQEASEARSDLLKMGCIASAFTHRREYYRDPNITHPDDYEIDTTCLIVPHTLPTNSEGIDKQQLRGTGIFIAYLLAKKYATEEEIIPAFGKAFWEESQKPDIQQLVATLIEKGRDAVSPLPDAEMLSFIPYTGQVR